MMKVVHRQPLKTADVSSARGTAGRELWQMVLSAVVLMVALFFFVGVTVDFIVTRISFETEAKVFKHFKVPAAKAKEAPNAAHFERVEAILSKLQREPKVPPLPYQLVLIEQAKPNAFAFPGGTIGVTTGLMDMLDDQIEMAFVLGHELGHFYSRDHLQGLGRAISFRIIMATIFGADAGADSLVELIEFIFQRDYSQKSEKAADRFGLELVYAAYGKIEGVDRLFQILLDEHEMQRWAYMFSTHPSPRERIDDLKTYGATLKAEP